MKHERVPKWIKDLLKSGGGPSASEAAAKIDINELWTIMREVQALKKQQLEREARERGEQGHAE